MADSFVSELQSASAAVGGAGHVNWEDLRVALVVSRAASFARAAETLAIDPATVSRRIAALEASLGTILFMRLRTGVRPTDAGRAVMAQIAEMDQKAGSLVDEATGRSAARGVVRLVGCPWTMARTGAIIAPKLVAMHPEIELRLVATRPPAPLIGSDPALSLWFETAATTGELRIPLGVVSYATYAAAGCTSTRTWLAHRNEEGPPRAPDRIAAARRAAGAKTGLTATDSLILREAVAAGVGMALLPVALADGDPRLVRRLDEPTLDREIAVHLHQDISQSRRVQILLSALRRDFATAYGGTETAERRESCRGGSLLADGRPVERCQPRSAA